MPNRNDILSGYLLGILTSEQLAKLSQFATQQKLHVVSITVQVEPLLVTGKQAN